MLELSVLNDLRPLARGAHFIVSACAGLLVYWLMRRTSSGTRMSLSFSASLWAHFFLDYYFRVP